MISRHGFRAAQPLKQVRKSPAPNLQSHLQPSRLRARFASTNFADQVPKEELPSDFSQPIRHYASQPARSGASATFLYTLGAAAVAGGGYYAYSSGSSSKVPSPPQPSAIASAAKEKAAETIGSTPNKAFTGGDQGFLSLKLESVEQVSHNTKRMRFSLPDSNDVSGMQVASALVTKYKGPEMEKPVIRPYTPVSDESEKGYLDLLVKRYEGGPMSMHLHDMAPGQRLDFKGPIPKYQWDENKHDSIAMIAGGTGITPYVLPQIPSLTHHLLLHTTYRTYDTKPWRFLLLLQHVPTHPRHLQQPQ